MYFLVSHNLNNLPDISNFVPLYGCIKGLVKRQLFYYVMPAIGNKRELLLGPSVRNFQRLHYIHKLRLGFRVK